MITTHTSDKSRNLDNSIVFMVVQGDNILLFVGAGFYLGILSSSWSKYPEIR